MDEHPSNDPLRPRYKRVILKLSGDAFGYPGKSGISIDETLSVARQAQRIVRRGVQLAVVVGAGNILRGAQFSAGGEVIKQATAHYMGMLATVLNGLALQDALESLNCETRLQTAIPPSLSPVTRAMLASPRCGSLNEIAAHRTSLPNRARLHSVAAGDQRRS